MINFKTFITEQADDGKLKHIHHPEDMPLMHGEQGFHATTAALQHAHEHLASGKHSHALTMKYDGSPSLVFGHHPRTGKFFVATKSAFNKNPKLNYTEHDIEQNHGHAPCLVEKLKAALHHLPKVAPKKGVYQGDVMFTHHDVQHNPNGSASFTPNTITYTAHGNDARHIKNAKLGLVVHQKYSGHIENMKASPKVDHENFKQHADVWHKTAEHDTSRVDYPVRSQLEFKKHMDAAHAIHNKEKHVMYKATEPHGGEGGHLNTYINHTVRTGEKPTAQGFANHLATKFHRQESQYKTEKSKERVRDEAQKHFGHIQSNKSHYDNLFKMHQHLQKAKNSLVDTLDSGHHDLEHHINNQPTKPEGYVVNHGSSPIKLVNRAEFSRANLLKARQ